MKKLVSVLAIAILSLSFAQAQSADEVIDAYFEVTGGKEAWMKIESVVMTGKMQPQPGIELPLTITMKKPNMVYSVAEFQGKKIVTAYDGTVGWMINPLMMATEPTKLPEEQLEQFEDQRIEDNFLNYAEKGHSVSYEGTENIEGTECHKIKLVKKDGKEEFHFFDTDSGVKVMQRTFMQEGPSKGQAIETFMSEYDEVAGVMMPFSMVTKLNGTVGFQFAIETVEANVKIDDSLFAFPEEKSEGK